MKTGTLEEFITLRGDTAEEIAPTVKHHEERGYREIQRRSEPDGSVIIRMQLRKHSRERVKLA